MLEHRTITDDAPRLAVLAELGLLDSQPEPLLDDLVSVAAALLGVPMGLISLVDRDRVWFKARFGVADPQVSRSHSFSDWVVAHPEAPLIVRDAAQDDRFRHHPLVAGPQAVRFYLGVPLVSRPEGIPIGALGVLGRDAREPTPSQVEALRAIARQVEDRLAQRRQSSSGSVILARAAEAGLRGALEGEDAGLWEWDVPTNRVSLSPHCRQLLGLPEGEEDAYRLWKDGVHPADLPAVRAALADLGKPGRDSFRVEYRFRRPDGTQLWLLDRGGVTVRDGGGGAVLVVGILVDITRQRHTASALVESEQRFRHVADQAPVLIWVGEADGACSFFNATWLNFTGRTMDQELGDGWAQGVHPDDLSGCLSTYREALTAAEGFQMEYRLRRADGMYRMLLDTGVPRFDEDGRFTGFIGSCIDIEDLYAARRRQQESEARLLEAQEVARLGHWRLDLRTGHVDWSPETYRIFGLDPLDGTPSFPDFVSRVHPDDMEDWQSYIDTLRSTGGPAEIEHRIVQSDGSVLTVSGRGRAELGAEGAPVVMYGTLQDITERAALAQESQRLLDIIERVPDLIAVATVEGAVVYANEALRTRCLPDAGVINGLGVMGDYHPPDMALTIAMEILPEVERHGSWTGVTEWKGVDHQLFKTLQTIMAHRDRGGVLTHYSIVARDITDQQRNEAELRAAKEQAEASARAKGDFLAIMSHELRTPLNGALGMLSLLAASPLGPDQRDQVETARGCSRTLLGLIDDILDFSRLDAGTIALASQPFRPREVVREVLAALAPKATSSGLRLVTEVQASAPERVQGDPLRLRQVLNNLVGNAVKFTPVGTVTVRVGAGPAGLRLAIIDTGIGMDEATQRRLFRPFSQADGSMTRRFGGTGLGLVITHQLVSLMGGSLSVVSTPGKGSVFTVDLPLPPAEPPRLPPLVVLDPIAPRRTLLVRHLRSLGLGVTGVDGLAEVPTGLILAHVAEDGIDRLVDLRAAGRAVVILLERGETGPPGFPVVVQGVDDETLLQTLLAACPEGSVPP